MRTAVLVCPGRGTYNAPELGYLERAQLDESILNEFEKIRTDHGQTSLTDLDAAARFEPSVHSIGRNASGLIYACTVADTLALQDVEIVAVTGNSMGWYSALACCGALNWVEGFQLVNDMGTMMDEEASGGQIVYPWMGEDWRVDLKRKDDLLQVVDSINTRHDHVLSLSIDLGGMIVVAGNERGLAAFSDAVPAINDRFPMRLRNHAAFHSSLLKPISERALDTVALHTWRKPALPLVDGRGHVWWPGNYDLDSLRHYTLGHQITETYDFSAAIRNSARAFAPDVFIVPGPGHTLGGAVAQSLILADWMGMDCKAEFQKVQAESCVLTAIGRREIARH